MGTNQISGSIALDASKLAGEVAREVSVALGQVMEQTMPALAEILEQVRVLAALLTAPALGLEDTVATLACHLPAGTSGGAEGVRAEYVAQFQADRLLAAGYGIVPLQGAALEHSVGAVKAKLPVLPSAEQVRNLSATEAVQLATQMNQRPDAGWRDEVTGLVSGGLVTDEVESFVGGLRDGTVRDLQHAVGSNVPGVDVDQYEATARADARLAQANRDPHDSWREDQ